MGQILNLLYLLKKKEIKMQKDFINSRSESRKHTVSLHPAELPQRRSEARKVLIISDQSLGI